MIFCRPVIVILFPGVFHFVSRGKKREWFQWTFLREMKSLKNQEIYLGNHLKTVIQKFTNQLH